MKLSINALLLWAMLLLASPYLRAETEMKGVEIWSWRSEGTLAYAALSGTNRKKTLDEVQAARLGGIEELESRLDHLAIGEHVILVGITYVKGFTCPDAKDIERIEDISKRKGLILSGCGTRPPNQT